jgi:hypothetical protein
MWWCTCVISALRKLRQEDTEFQANLGYNSKILSPGGKKNVIEFKLWGITTVLWIAAFLYSHYSSLPKSVSSLGDCVTVYIIGCSLVVSEKY